MAERPYPLRAPCRSRYSSTATRATTTPSRSSSPPATTRSTCARSPPSRATARSRWRPSTRAGLTALAGLEGVPVAAGAAGPRVGELRTAPDIHGETGLDGYDLPPRRGPAGPPAAAIEAMADTLRPPRRSRSRSSPPAHSRTSPRCSRERPEAREAYPRDRADGRLDRARQHDPRRQVQHPRRRRGRRPGVRERSAGHDDRPQPHAPGARDTATIDGPGSAALPGEPARAVAAWMEFFGSRYESVFGIFAPPLHDPCTIALLIDPAVMRRVEHVRRGRDGGPLDARHDRRRPPRPARPAPDARVALELDAPRFWELVIGSLERRGLAARCHRDQVLLLEAGVVRRAAVPLVAERVERLRRTRPRGRSCGACRGRRSSARTAP